MPPLPLRFPSEHLWKQKVKRLFPTGCLHSLLGLSFPCVIFSLSQRQREESPQRAMSQRLPPIPDRHVLNTQGHCCDVVATLTHLIHYPLGGLWKPRTKNSLYISGVDSETWHIRSPKVSESVSAALARVNILDIISIYIPISFSQACPQLWRGNAHFFYRVV